MRRGTRILLWTTLAAVVVAAAGIVYLLTVPPPLERWLQDRLLLALREHYQTEVKLDNLRITLIPGFYASADNFVLPNRSDRELPPLITAHHLVIQANVMQLLRTPVRITTLRIDGMEIRVAPKRQQPAQSARASPRRHTHFANFLIDRVEADGTMLYVMRRDPAREPMGFELRTLSLRSAGFGQPMTFTAVLTNDIPPGLITTAGRFGPWNFDQPSATAVDGHYDFEHADLSVFSGISGILSSQGDYSGMLQNIVVDGATDTPDFQLDRGGEPVHLITKFHATVDGTNGNTYLQPVAAHFLKSDVVTNGEVVRRAGEKGKTISLDVDLQHAYVEDVLALATKAHPPMLTGRLGMKAKLTLPPGREPVLRKMLLSGRFGVTGGNFSSKKISNTLDSLSRRGQGKPNDTSISNVASEFRGDFTLRNGTIRFSRLQFTVPGVAAQMNGSYVLKDEELNFLGDVRLDASMSHTMTGAKRWLLAPFDPLFMKHGAGTWLPVTVTGTRAHPAVKLQMKKLL